MNRYTFDKEKHIHQLDGKPLYGITSVLGVIAKPALIQWSANMACEFIDQARHSEKFRIEDLDGIIAEARTAHLKKRDKAGEFGTGVHEDIEKIVVDAIENNNGIVDLSYTIDNPAIQHFIEWSRGKKFLESEKNLYSEKHWIGGIVDLLFESEGKKYIGDIKTSSGIYPEMFLQCAGYEIMLEEMGHKVDGYEIINLKKDGTIQTARSYGTERNKEAFLSALNLFKTLQDLKQENGNNNYKSNKKSIKI